MAETNSLLALGMLTAGLVCGLKWEGYCNARQIDRGGNEGRLDGTRGGLVRRRNRDSDNSGLDGHNGVREG